MAFGRYSSHKMCFVVKLLGHSDAGPHLVNIFKYSDMYKNYMTLDQSKRKLEQETYFLNFLVKVACTSRGIFCMQQDTLFSSNREL